MRNRNTADKNASRPKEVDTKAGAENKDVPVTPTTTQEALAFNPAGYRVRLTSWKDFMAVLKARYMDLVFKLTSLILVVQIVYAFGRAPEKAGLTGNVSLPAASEALDHALHVPVLDACLMAYGELRWIAPVFFLMISALLLRRGRSVYMLDFATFEPPDDWKITHDELIQVVRNVAKHRAERGESANTEADIEFQAKVLDNSGTGQATAWPPAIVRCLNEGTVPKLCMEETREEAETIICQCLEALFEKTGVQPKEIDFLVINCSLFSPTPSLCAMACNKFRMRSNLRTYNLSGMGCSASLLSVDLASELLRSNPNSIAVVVSTELISQALYHGHQKGMLLQNTLFRCGGAAVMLTNKASRIHQARYRLRHLVRTQCTDDESYAAVYEQARDT